jgi:hypothetical protein
MMTVTKKSQLICPMILEDHRLDLLLERSRVLKLFEIFVILNESKNLFKLGKKNISFSNNYKVYEVFQNYQLRVHCFVV